MALQHRTGGVDQDRSSGSGAFDQRRHRSSITCSRQSRSSGENLVHHGWTKTSIVPPQARPTSKAS